MRLIDSHLHLEALDNNALQLMALSGIKAIIGMVANPEVIPGINRDFPPDAIFDYCDRVLDFHAWTTKKYFMIDTYACVGVSMAGIPRRYEESLTRLRSYIGDRDQIVGIGEIGFEPESSTCRDMKVQEEIIEFQLDLAKQFDKSVCFHTPPTQKAKWFERYLSMIKEVDLDPSRVIIDHADSSVVNIVTDAGCYAAISVQPRRRVRAKDAAEMIMSGDRSRILVDSDTSLPHESDPLAVPRTAFELKKLGMKEPEIEKILWGNPLRAFGISEG